MKILDTDHCVAVLRRRLDLDRAAPRNEPLATTVITVAELVHGALRSKRPTETLAATNAFLSQLIVLPFSERGARIFAQLRADLEGKGQRLDHLDLEIASIALAHQKPLVSHNRDHFDRVSGLAIEDWLA